MTAQLIGNLVLWLIVTIIAIAVIVWLLHLLYHRSTMETSFVRTGFGGDKVVIKGGALVLPIIHEITPVGMGMERTTITCAKQQSVITKDKMRVDINAEFYLHVESSSQAVGLAAATLGSKTLESKSLAEFFSGEFESALRVAGALMTMDEILVNRPAFIDLIIQNVNQALSNGGLILDTVAIRSLDQTELEYFNPANRFDAEGLTELIGEIEEKRKVRNDIEQDSMVAIRQRNLEAERQTLALELEIENTRTAQSASIANEKTAREAEVERVRIDNTNRTKQHEIIQRQSTEKGEVAAKEELETTRIASERKLDEMRVERELNMRKLELGRAKAVEFQEISDQIELLSKRLEEANASIASNQAKAQAVAAEETITTARNIELADRNAAVEKIRAKAAAETVHIQAQAEQERAAIAAEAERLRNEADNILDAGARDTRIKEKMIDQLQTLIKESVKPLEKIESIKVVHVGGMGGEGKKSPTDEVIDSAMRYRVQAPMIDELMKEIGVKDSKIAAMGDVFRAAKDIKSLTAKTEANGDED